ncbi:MAG: PPOX class F420-dependent oxidoreductase [Thermoproteota archaeon]|jgi:pyridoxamine 5'-phosphate oxidase family protein|nr:PPOX class F420-dependent oxidoreductase [Thermoproteota archaeon]
MTNSIFSQKEIEYLNSQQLARIATAAVSAGDERSIQPDVVPVGFDFDGNYFYIGGMNLLKSTKYRNVLKNNKVALVIDDLKSIDRWDPRGMKVYGTADIVTRQGGYMDSTDHPNPQYIRITPKRKWSWGIEEPVFVEGRFNVKRAKAA